MKNKHLLIITSALLSITLSGCNKSKEENYTKVDEIYENSRVFSVNYDKVNYEAGDKFWADNNDNWGGGCSAVSKNIDGHRIVGRNMDLNISDRAAYVVHTDASEGKYETIGLAYTFRDYAPTYVEVKEKGLTEEFNNILPFLCDDVMNEYGLHIELDMRHAECDFSGNDQFSLEGTNPGKRRVHMFELPRYIAENCKTVEEAKNYVENELDIYSKYGYWNYCFLISDSDETGSTQHASLLEFSAIGVLGEVFNGIKGKDFAKPISWIDEENLDDVTWLRFGETGNETPYPMTAVSQTNFYVNQWAYERQDIKSGEGRFITIQSLIGDVNSKQDMYNLMRRISYSNFYADYDLCKAKHFDPRSENVGEFQGATYDFIFNENYEDLIRALFNGYTEPVRSMTREEKEKANCYWESSFTEVVDCTERNIEVRFFENEDLRFKISFGGIEKLETLPTLSPEDYSDLPVFPF